MSVLEAGVWNMAGSSPLPLRRTQRLPWLRTCNFFWPLLNRLCVLFLACVEGCGQFDVQVVPYHGFTSLWSNLASKATLFPGKALHEPILHGLASSLRASNTLAYTSQWYPTSSRLSILAIAMCQTAARCCMPSRCPLPRSHALCFNPIISL